MLEHNYEIYARRFAVIYPAAEVFALISRAERGEVTWEWAYGVLYSAASSV
jgi:hypothetical protein